MDVRTRSEFGDPAAVLKISSNSGWDTRGLSWWTTSSDRVQGPTDPDEQPQVGPQSVGRGKISPVTAGPGAA